MSQFVSGIFTYSCVAAKYVFRFSLISNVRVRRTQATLNIDSQYIFSCSSNVCVKRILRALRTMPIEREMNQIVSEHETSS